MLHAEPLMRLSAELDAPQTIGQTPLGTRSIMYMKRGAFVGAKLRGDVLPGGGDWILARQDGVFQLDIRLTLRTDDDALIYVVSRGMLDIAPELRQRIRDGETIDASAYYFRTMLTFETGTERYLWLNRLIAAGVGTRTPTGMSTEVFALT